MISVSRVSSLEHQSDAPETSVSCVYWDSKLATVCNSLSRAGFSGKRVLELWPILFGSVDVSEAFDCCPDADDSGAIRQSSQVSSAKRFNSCGNIRPKLQQPRSRACVLKPLLLLIQSSELSPTIPTKLLEILEHFLTCVPKRSLPTLEDTQMDAALNLPQRSIHVCGTASLGQHTDGCSHAQVSPILLASYQDSTARLEIAQVGRTRKKAFLLRVWLSIASKLGLAGETAHARFLPSHVVQSRLAFGTSSVANTTIGATNLFGHEFVVAPRCATRRWTMHENQSHGCLHPPGLEMMPLDAKRRVQERHGSSRFSVLVPQVSDRVLEKLSIPQPSKHHSVPSSTFWIKRRSSYERKSRGQWRTSQSVQRYEKRAHLAADYLALPRRTRELIETFAPLAEGAIFWNQPRLCLYGV